MESRRTFLKQMAALGVGAPLVGSLAKVQTTLGRSFDAGHRALAQPALSSRKLAGQRVIYSYPGLTVPDVLVQAIKSGEAAGVIFFGENIESHAQIAAVVEQLKQAHEQSGLAAPLLLMTDQEGGPVRRLPGGPEVSAKEVGQAVYPAAAASGAGTVAGQNLAGVGMNVNLAPVLGVYRQPGDFLDAFERSFSNDPAIVTDCATAFITAQQQHRVAATAKHFPGLGTASSSENTDLGPVTLPVALATLRDIDESPYPAAIEAGVKLVMLSWAIYPELDASYPAGLSPTVVQGELRERLGFGGVTITDALEAGALSAFGSDQERAMLAARAGMDLILCSSRDVGQGLDVMAALADALDSGELDRDEFVAAHGRVTVLRASLSDSRYFPETGHTLSLGFLAYWDRFGGLPVFGYPITDAYTDPDTGFVTQYCERARFEWQPGTWPERFDVALGLLGIELAERNGLLGTGPFQPVDGHDDANCTFFPETGHRLCFGFRDFWNANGGLAIYGYPISEEFEEGGFTVQYFERQRLEYHPENSPEWQVEGGLLGAALLG